MLAVLDHQLRTALGWLFLAAFVDSTDGVLARAAGVAEHAPAIDGTRLDDLVDYLTYVFVPAVIIVQAGLLPAGWGWIAAGAIVLASAFGFAQHDAKSADHFFTGFPSYWNIVAVYLLAAGWPKSVNAAVVLLLAALVFVPLGYVYPSRTPRQRWLTVSLGVVWGIQIAAIIWTLPDVPRWLFWSALAFPAYYVGLSLVLQRSRKQA
jgi:phosphatidylcholine synthase